MTTPQQLRSWTPARLRTTADAAAAHAGALLEQVNELRQGGVPASWTFQSAEAARTALAELAPPGTVLTLTPDPTQPERDRYGRLLGYLDPAGTDLGLQLLADGYVRTWGEHPRSDPYEVAEANASHHGLGIWGQCS